MLPAGSPLSDWLTWLETLSPREIDLGLERVRSVLERLALTTPKTVLLVAGTNGKGSSVVIAQALLTASGYRVGAYSSPHVVDFNERIALDGIPVTDDAIITAFERVEASRQGLSLTYFEYTTLAALVIFSEHRLDVWVLEIGLGGRLDACNVVSPTASLITNVTLDHCDWLGPDVETIALEKAGVMRPGVPTVFGAREVPDSLRRHADTIGAELLIAGRDFDFERVSKDRWNWRGRNEERLGLRAPGLAGEFQLGNAAAVLALLQAAGLDAALEAERLNRVLPDLSLSGRLQSLQSGGKNWLLDVAHNAAAASVLADSLATRNEGGRLWAIIGALNDKDVESIAIALNDQVDHWLAVTASSPRALQSDELARRIANVCNRPCRIMSSLDEAMEFAESRAAAADRILITGSFYIVGPALQTLTLYSQPE